jgi:hypothetical protein
VEFWRDLSELVERDGIVAMVCPSPLPVPLRGWKSQ